MNAECLMVAVSKTCDSIAAEACLCLLEVKVSVETLSLQLLVRLASNVDLIRVNDALTPL